MRFRIISAAALSGATLVATMAMPTQAGAATSHATRHAATSSVSFGGYTAAPSGVNTVSGDMTVPSVTCTSAVVHQGLVAEIKIGGSLTLAEALIDTNCVKGSAVYFVSGAAGLVTFRLPASPGDVIAVTATESPTAGTSVTATDTTSGLSDTAGSPGAIAKNVQIGTTFYPQATLIPTFTSVSFTSVNVDGAPLSAASPVSSNLLGKGLKTFASTGALATDGTDFSVTFVAN